MLKNISKPSGVALSITMPKASLGTRLNAACRRAERTTQEQVQHTAAGAATALSTLMDDKFGQVNVSEN